MRSFGAFIFSIFVGIMTGMFLYSNLGWNETWTLIGMSGVTLTAMYLTGFIEKK